MRSKSWEPGREVKSASFRDNPFIHHPIEADAINLLPVVEILSSDNPGATDFLLVTFFWLVNSSVSEVGQSDEGVGSDRCPGQQ